MRHLIDQEVAFGSDVLVIPEAKAFFRKWRKRNWRMVGAWARIRDDEYQVKGKKRLGTVLVSAIRRHLVALQRNLCCYCQRELQGIAHARPIDHVLPKTEYPQYAFHYRNLAVSCFDCNSRKSDDNWSAWPKDRKRYVIERWCKQFFHPRYHVYDEHVRFLRMRTNGASVSAYIGVTEQGKHLCQSLLADSARREVVLGANPRLEAALLSLRDDIQMLEDSVVAQDMESFLSKLESLVLPVERRDT